MTTKRPQSGLSRSLPAAPVSGLQDQADGTFELQKGSPKDDRAPLKDSLGEIERRLVELGTTLSDIKARLYGTGLEEGEKQPTGDGAFHILDRSFAALCRVERLSGDLAGAI